MRQRAAILVAALPALELSAQFVHVLFAPLAWNNRAMQVMSALYQAPPDSGDAGRGIVLALARLRAALAELEEEKR